MPSFAEPILPTPAYVQRAADRGFAEVELLGLERSGEGASGAHAGQSQDLGIRRRADLRR